MPSKRTTKAVTTAVEFLRLIAAHGRGDSLLILILGDRTIELGTLVIEGDITVRGEPGRPYWLSGGTMAWSAVAAVGAALSVGGHRLSVHSAPVVLLVSLAGLYREYRAQRRRRSLAAVGALWPAPRARLAAHSMIVRPGAKLRLEHVELVYKSTNAPPEALIRCEEGSLSTAGCVLSRAPNGIECLGYGRVDLKETVVRNCGGSGVVLSGGSCTVDRCSFASNRRFGCEARGGVSLTLARSDFAQGGICVSDRGEWALKSKVRVTDCSVSGHAACLPGISVVGDAVPGGVLHEQSSSLCAGFFEEEEQDSQSSMVAASRCEGRLSRLRDQVSAATQEDSGGVRFERCVIKNVNGAGLYLLGRHSVAVEDCLVAQAAMTGMEALRGARPLIRRCKIFDCAGGGLITHQGAGTVVEDSEISRNGGGGNVGVLDGSICSLSGCQINGSKTVGLHVSGATAGLINSCVRDSQSHGIVVGGGAASPQGGGVKTELLLTGAVIDSKRGCAILYAPGQKGFFARSSKKQPLPDHVLVARRSEVRGKQISLALESPTTGVMVDCKFDPEPCLRRNWLGNWRLDWAVERILHVGARLDTCPLSQIDSPHLLDIIQYASR